MIKRTRWYLFVPILSFLIAAQPGCEDKRRHGASGGAAFEEVPAPLSTDASPDNVARALLAALGRAQEARSRGLGVPERRQSYEKAMAEILSLTATKEVVEHVRSSGSGSLPKNISDDAALTLCAESWVSLVAHYIKGVQPETFNVSTAGSQTFAEVHVAADPPEDKTILASLQPTNPAATTQAQTSPPRVLDGQLRAEALRRGINPALRADIQIKLKNVDGRWRATQLSIGPRGVTFLPTVPAPAPPASQPGKA